MIEEKERILETKTMTELYDEAYVPRLPVIDDFLYCGTYIYAGAPKIGKSFFMLQLGYHVSKGIKLWNHKVRKGTVLYLALEDNYARLQQRLGMMYADEPSDDFHLNISAGSVKDGLMDEMESFVKAHPDTCLIIVDTLQKVRESGDDNYSYSSDYEIIDSFKKFTDVHDLCILIVHHTRKMESTDNFDKISGTNGLAGASDGCFVMAKNKRIEGTATISICGRDQADQEITVERDEENCIWKKVKSEKELFKGKPDEVLEAIACFVNRDNPEWHGTATELIEAIPGLSDMIVPNTLVRRLNVRRYNLLKDYHIHYESMQRTPDRKEFKLRYDDNDDYLF